MIWEFLGKRKTDLLELRKYTTMTMGWIAQELNARVPKSVWSGLGKKRRNRSRSL
jgi:hypothetical protein